MPRRTMTLGRQPATFNFQDNAGPLVNGLAHAVSQFLGAGRDRAMIDMQRGGQAADDARADRALDLQEAALGLKQQAASGTAAAKSRAPVPSHVADNLDSVVDRRALQEGLVEEGISSTGVPTGRYSPIPGSQPQDIAALERIRKAVFLDSGIDPMTLAPTLTGKWETPPDVAQEQIENERQIRAEMGGQPAAGGDLLATALGTSASGLSQEQMFSDDPAAVDQHRQSQQSWEQEWQQLTADLPPEDLAVLQRVMMQGNPIQRQEAIRRLRARAR